MYLMRACWLLSLATVLLVTPATALAQTQHQLDPQGDDFAFHHVVLIGHSMGGVIARLLVSSSGLTLWDAAFTRPPSALAGSPEDRASAEAIFVFEPWPPARRAILIAAPHRGSPIAKAWQARVLARFPTRNADYDPAKPSGRAAVRKPASN